MTKESLQVILDILNQVSIPMKQENGLEIFQKISKAKSEVEEGLNGKSDS